MSRSVALFALALLAPAARAGVIYSYNAGLGTLPTAQGWSLIQNDPNYPAPTVGGGVLRQFPQVSISAQFWQQNSVPLNFATGSYSYELNLHLVSSNYLITGPASQRSWYYMSVTDAVGRVFNVGFASNGITINTDANSSPSNGVPFTPFNTTDSFHLYRLDIDHGVGSLYIDGTFFASTLVAPPPGVDPVTFNRVFFGEGAGVGISQSELRSANFGTIATPEPASAVVFGLGLAGVAGVALRRRKARSVDLAGEPDRAGA